MPNIPNIVRERLKAGAVASGHPEANILSAFAEDSLSARERREVMDHLAHCGDCRDAVALALPAIEPADVLAKPAPSRWLAWPALRWGIAVAGLAVIASFGLLQYRNREQARSIAKFAPSEVHSSSSAVPEPVAGSLSPNPTLSADESKQKARNELPAAKDSTHSALGSAFLARNSPAPEQRWIAPATAGAAHAFHPYARGLVGGNGVTAGFGPRVPTPGQQQQQSGQNAAMLGRPMSRPQGTIATPAPAPTTVTVEVSGESPLLATEDKNIHAQSLDAPGQDANTQAQSLETQTQNLQAASAPPPVAQLANDDASRFSRAKAATAPQPIHAPMAELPRWNINADGKLQRTLDRGQSWQDVDVTAAAPTVAGMAFSVSSAAPAEVAGAAVARKADKSLDKKQSSGPVFRVVVANGPDVWAGGVAAALYHSLDAGNHWMRVIPSDGSTTLATDIVSMDFPDAQHGSITTSTSEIWITDDAGKTWRKH